jgi:hypothetical protein
MSAPTQYPLEEVVVEDNDDYLSISLGFVSPEDQLDTLHVVCGKIFTGASPTPSEEKLYLERTDQSQSIAGGLVSIRCREHAIDLEIDREAQDALGLPAAVSLRFVCSDIERMCALAGFRAMALLNPNEDIRFDD